MTYVEPTTDNNTSAAMTYDPYPAALPQQATSVTPPPSFDAITGNGIYRFPSGLPETYYAQLLNAIAEQTTALRHAYPKGRLWREFEAPDNPPLAAYVLAQEDLIRPLEVLRYHIVEQLQPQLDPAYQVCDTEFITVRWYTGEPESVGSFFKFNPETRQLELFRHGRKPFVEIHVDPGKSIVSHHTCHIKFCITLTPMEQHGELIAGHAREIGTLYDPLGCRRFTGRSTIKTEDLVATPTMDAVCFLTTRGASAFNQYVKRQFQQIPLNFTPARGVKHRAAEQRAPLFVPRLGEPYAPRVLLHGGVHLQRRLKSKPAFPITQ